MIPAHNTGILSLLWLSDRETNIWEFKQYLFTIVVRKKTAFWIQIRATVFEKLLRKVDWFYKMILTRLQYKSKYIRYTINAVEFDKEFWSNIILRKSINYSLTREHWTGRHGLTIFSAGSLSIHNVNIHRKKILKRNAYKGIYLYNSLNVCICLTTA